MHHDHLGTIKKDPLSSSSHSTQSDNQPGKGHQLLRKAWCKTLPHLIIKMKIRSRNTTVSDDVIEFELKSNGKENERGKESGSREKGMAKKKECCCCKHQDRGVYEPMPYKPALDMLPIMIACGMI